MDFKKIRNISIRTIGIDEERKVYSMLQKLGETVDTLINLDTHNDHFERFWEYTKEGDGWTWYNFYTYAYMNFETFEKQYNNHIRNKKINRLK